MKKSLLALAVLGAYAGVASAQSSVQLFGTLDLNGRYIKNDGRDRQLSMGTDGVNSSEIRFQGIEDLGGGLKAGFNLRSGINPDNGTDNAKFWNRRATVSLYSNAGELRLGRDYVPTFWTTAIFDAFGYNGIGSTGNVQRGGQVRQDNSIGYFLPSNLGGFYGQIAWAPFKNTVIRINGTETTYDRITPTNLTLTALNAANDARNGQFLRYLLASDQITRSASGPSGAGVIANGKLTLDNVDSIFGWRKSLNAHVQRGDATIENRWTSWLSSQLSAGILTFDDTNFSPGMSFFAPNATANPLPGHWTVATTAGGPTTDASRPASAHMTDASRMGSTAVRA